MVDSMQSDNDSCYIPDGDNDNIAEADAPLNPDATTSMDKEEGEPESSSNEASSSNDNDDTSTDDNQGSDEAIITEQKPNYTVDICATCLVKKPPKLPLREELPSLGFELIYNARGVGAETSKQKSKQELENFRQEQEERQKKRWLPPSPRKLRRKLQQQKERERELQIPTALSYGAYEYGLHHSFDVVEDGRMNKGIKGNGRWSLLHHASSEDGTRSTQSSSQQRSQQQRLQQHREEDQQPFTLSTVLSEGSMLTGQQKKRWGRRFFRRPNKQAATAADNNAADNEKQNAVQHVLDKAEFGDLLAPMDQPSSTDNGGGTTDTDTSCDNCQRPPPGDSSSLLNVVSTKPLIHKDVDDGTMEEYTIDGFPDFHFVTSENVNLPGFSSDNDDPINNSKDNKNNPFSSLLVPGGVQSLQDEELPHAQQEKAMCANNDEVTNDNYNGKPSLDQAVKSALAIVSHNIYSYNDEDEDGDESNNNDIKEQAISADEQEIKRAPTSEKEREKVHNAFAKLFAVFTKSPKKKKREEVEEEVGQTLSKQQTDNDETEPDTSDKFVERQAEKETTAQSDIPAVDQEVQNIPPAKMPPTVLGVEVVPSPSAPSPVPAQEVFDFFAATDDEKGNSDFDEVVDGSDEIDVQKAAATMSWMETTRMALETVTSGGLGFDDFYQGDDNGEKTADQVQTLDKTKDSQPKKEDETPWDWPAAASGAIQTVASDFAKATGLLQPDDEKKTISHDQGNSIVSTSPSESDDQTSLLDTELAAPWSHSFELQHQVPPSLSYHSVPPPTQEAPGHPVAAYPASPIQTSVQGDDVLPIDSKNARVAMIPTDENPLGFRSDLLLRISLLEVLGRVDCHAFEIQDAIQNAPELAQVKKQDDGRYPLHTLCARGLMDRSKVHENELTDLLLNDVTVYKECLAELLGAFPPAALALDNNQDLPVHLIARTLMEWEACWYESVYARAASENNSKGKAAKAITNLYQAMSSCVEVILRPIVKDVELCQCAGSVGQIYPLHIATIFTVTIPSLAAILESYPIAATVPCDLDDLGTFIPDNSLPLVLHDSLSTDFPKWELGKRNSATEDSIEPDNVSEIRRSDLLFAYNPNVKPYRLDSTRIRRMEDMLREEAAEIVECERSKLSRPMERFWVWLCTFQDLRSNKPAYSKSVKRVVKDMPLAAVHYLSSVVAPSGRPVLCDAAPKCAAAIRVEFERSPPVQIWETQPHIGRLLTNHKGFVAPFARSIFNIKERGFPTSFVILPYQLEMNEDRTVGVKDTNCFAVAAKFAECLLRLSDPRALLYYLDRKSKAYYNRSIYSNAANDDIRHRTFKSFEAVEKKLISLYKPGQTFLYLLDEDSAMPLVPEEEENGYPIILNEPTSIIKKLLPLMLPGMVLMRGDKALSVLMNVILDGDVTVVPQNWIVAANNLTRFLSTRGNESFSDITGLRDCVANFLYRAMSLEKRVQSPQRRHSEWNVELATLKTLLETSTGAPKFAGLRTIRNESWALYWTQVLSSGNSVKSQSGMDLGKLAKKHDDLSLQLAELRNIEAKDVASLSSEHRQQKSTQDETVDSEQAIVVVSVTSMDPESGEHSTMPLASEPCSTTTKSSGPLGFPRPPSEQTSNNQRFPRIPQLIVPLAETVEANEEEELDDAILRARTLPQQVGETNGEYATFQGNPKEDARYNMLFSDLAVDERKQGDEYGLIMERGSNGERIWNDITEQLDKSGFVNEDMEVMHLKLLLAEQAKKSGNLSKRVRDLTETTERFVTEEDMKVQEQVLGPGVQAETNCLPSLQQSRKLLIRLCDLEERLLCDEIDIQHLRMESLSMYYEIDEIDPAVTQRFPTPLGTSKNVNAKAAQGVSKPATSVPHVNAESTGGFPSNMSSLTGISNGPPRIISMVTQTNSQGAPSPDNIPLSPSTKSTHSCSTDPGSASNPVVIVPMTPSTTIKSLEDEIGSSAGRPLDLTIIEDEDGGKSEATPLDLTSCGGDFDENEANDMYMPLPSLAGTSIACPVDLTRHNGSVASWIKFHDSSGQLHV